MTFKKLTLLSIVAFVLATSFSSASAGICSRGVIETIKAGGWNSDDLFIKMDYRSAPNQHVGTLWPPTVPEADGYMRFRANELSVEKMESIRSLAYIALATGPRLFEVRSSTGDCSRADEVTIYDDAY